MEKVLTPNKIEYILFHLNQHIDVSDVRNYFYFGQHGNNLDKPSITFPLSSQNINKNFRIDNLPVLFPIDETTEFFQFDDKGNLYFKHDLLKSAFYLLSGYQETQPYAGDHLKRFTYHDSIQKQLMIVDRPIVNEYFSIIIKAIKQFCEKHQIKIVKKNPWGEKSFALFLTHDIDRVDKWTFMEIKNRLKMVIRSGFVKHWAYLFEAIKYYNSGENPYWNFEWMKSLEQELNFNSTWFFLPQGHPQIDAYYSFSEKRIGELVEFFTKCGDSVALHGTYNSREDTKVMSDNLSKVQGLTSQKINASRQHWLSFKYPQTLRILENLKIIYDSSWGFAEHYGWRNSYCSPFHPYDLENERMMDIWELPLNAMDVTFFQYMKLSLDEAFSAIKNMIKTCIKYNGLFVLLWHNSHFNETVLPGITRFYKDLLPLIKSYNPLIYKPNKENEIN